MGMVQTVAAAAGATNATPRASVWGDPAAFRSAPPHVSDERRDLDVFAAYVRRLSPGGLYDVWANLDPDRYPQRFAAVEREMERRRHGSGRPGDAPDGDALQPWRVAASAAVFAFVALLLRAIGGCTISASGHEHLPFFTDLASASPQVARMLLPLAWLGSLTCLGALAGRGGQSLVRATREGWQRRRLARTAPPRRRAAGWCLALALVVLDLLLWRLLH